MGRSPVRRATSTVFASDFRISEMRIVRRSIKKKEKTRKRSACEDAKTGGGGKGERRRKGETEAG